MKKLPNILTLMRLFLIFPIIYNIQYQAQNTYWISICLIIFALGTDIADGWFARKFKAESEFGAMLDSVTDKAMVYSILFIPISYFDLHS